MQTEIVACADPAFVFNGRIFAKVVSTANLDFYALSDDLHALFAFLFAETDVVIYELYSRDNCEIRSFRTLSELTEAFDLGAHETAHLILWSPSVRPRPLIDRIEVTGRPCLSFDTPSAAPVSSNSISATFAIALSITAILGTGTRREPNICPRSW
jgi:hypothetical protein